MASVQSAQLVYPEHSRKVVRKDGIPQALASPYYLPCISEPSPNHLRSLSVLKRRNSGEGATLVRLWSDGDSWGKWDGSVIRSLSVLKLWRKWNHGVRVPFCQHTYFIMCGIGDDSDHYMSDVMIWFFKSYISVCAVDLWNCSKNSLISVKY